MDRIPVPSEAFSKWVSVSPSLEEQTDNEINKYGKYPTCKKKTDYELDTVDNLQTVITT